MINSIRRTNFYSNTLNKYSYKSDKGMSKTNFTKLPSFNNAISFTGSRYLTLLGQYERLSESSAFPPDIKEMVETELKKRSKVDKRLIDIHKEKYSKLNEFNTLKEIKEEYPEFENVLSDTQVQYGDKSFIHRVKNGEEPYFSPEKDLAVQLLQLYWADCFSLCDIHVGLTNTSAQPLFQKLNIPVMNKKYSINLLKSIKDQKPIYKKDCLAKVKDARAVAKEKLNKD